jgi:hypothetical protein
VNGCDFWTKNILFRYFIVLLTVGQRDTTQHTFDNNMNARITSMVYHCIYDAQRLHITDYIHI